MSHFKKLIITKCSIGTNGKSIQKSGRVPTYVEHALYSAMSHSLKRVSIAGVMNKQKLIDTVNGIVVIIGKKTGAE